MVISIWMNCMYPSARIGAAACPVPMLCVVSPSGCYMLKENLTEFVRASSFNLLFLHQDILSSRESVAGPDGNSRIGERALDRRHHRQYIEFIVIP